MRWRRRGAVRSTESLGRRVLDGDAIALADSARLARTDSRSRRKRGARARASRVHPPLGRAAWLTHFEVEDGGVYAVFALEQALLFNRPGRRPSASTANISRRRPSTVRGRSTARSSSHKEATGSPTAYLDPDFVVAIVNIEDLRAWEDRIAALARALPRNLATTSLVYAAKTTSDAARLRDVSRHATRGRAVRSRRLVGTRARPRRATRRVSGRSRRDAAVRLRERRGRDVGAA